MQKLLVRESIYDIIFKNMDIRLSSEMIMKAVFYVAQKYATMQITNPSKAKTAVENFTDSGTEEEAINKLFEESISEQTLLQVKNTEEGEDD